MQYYAGLQSGWDIIELCSMVKLNCKQDKEELNRLKDKFDEKNIEKWIEKVQERLYQLIDESHYLHARIFFKANCLLPQCSYFRK